MPAVGHLQSPNIRISVTAVPQTAVIQTHLVDADTRSTTDTLQPACLAILSSLSLLVLLLQDSALGAC